MKKIALVLIAVLGSLVQGADWPARPVRIVAPFGPAGAADKFARVLADYLPAEIKQPVVVENRGGGGGIVGSAQVARAEPDGYALLISSPASGRRRVTRFAVRSTTMSPIRTGSAWPAQRALAPRPTPLTCPDSKPPESSMLSPSVAGDAGLRRPAAPRSQDRRTARRPHRQRR